jgi:cytochrome P450
MADAAAQTRALRDRSEVTIDFDHHDPKLSADRTAAAHELRECPVSWTESHGGYWVFSAHQEAQEVGRRADVFASGNDHGNGPRQGLNIPFIATAAGGIIESDAPRHTQVRRQMGPWFSQENVDTKIAQMEEDVTFFIDQIIEKGEADLVKDLSGPFPGLVTLRLLGLPVELYQPFSDILHKTVYLQPGTPEREAVDGELLWLAGEVWQQIEKKKADPQDDYLSFLSTVKVDGEPMPPAEVLVEAILTIGAGLDTTTSLMGHTFRWLSKHPEAKAWLLEDPARMGPACEEFLRTGSPINATARTVMKDHVVRDFELKAGDRVWMFWHAANHDPAVFECPDEVRLDRPQNRHVAFAAGPHRCLGMRFARAEWKVMVSQVLKRMPDFVVDDDAVVPVPDVSLTGGFISMPVTFTPGPRIGPGKLKDTVPTGKPRALTEGV